MAQLYCTDLSTEDYVMAVEDDFHMTAPERFGIQNYTIFINMRKCFTYSIVDFRVNGVVRNSAAFAEVYECSTGSAMNPSNKCTIW